MLLTYLLDQDIHDLKVLIADNDSTDGTPEMVDAQLKNHFWTRPNKPYLDIALKRAGSVAGGPENNIPYMRRYLSEFVLTPYIFFLDSDVLLPPGILKPVFLEFLTRKAHVGIYGIRYEAKADHVKMGASFMDTSVARKINWKIDAHACECRSAHIQLGSMNLGSDYTELSQARHLKVL